MSMSPPPPTNDVFRAHPPTWCPGCGDFGIWMALKGALNDLRIRPDGIAVVFGIGCSGNMVNFVRCYGFHGIHGRALPVAEGIRLANHQLPVVVIGGDGDGLGEGMGHFIHAMRGNPNITYILHDNQVYGLTKGQHSPTAPRGFVSPTAPEGVLEEPVNPIALALAGGASFVSRGFAGNVDSLQRIIVAALQHKGFAFVDVLQPCVTFNHHNTYAWYYKRVYELEGVKHDPTNFAAAWKRASEPLEERIPTGIFFRGKKPSLEEQQPILSSRTLVDQRPRSPRDIAPLTALYR